MTDFKIRSSKKELLDQEAIPFNDIRKNMLELEFINSNLGGHTITINGIRQIMKGHLLANANMPFSICEIGCGGGDNLAVICKWAKTNQIEITCTGIDINPECIQFAVKRNAAYPIRFVCADYRNGLPAETRPSIIFSSLFCHHFQDAELVEMVKWMKQNAATGFMINDLHRHPVAYYSIKFLTRIFSRSYLVKNDAPLSVLRGFKKSEWLKIFESAGIDKFTIKWMWAFRHMLIFVHS